MSQDTRKEFDPSMLGKYLNYKGDLDDHPGFGPAVHWVVVPMARSAEHVIDPAMSAHIAGIPIVVLCSHEAKAAEVASLLDQYKFRNWLVVDVPPNHKLPDIELLAHTLIPPQAQQEPGSNLSHKRNLALIMARLSGAENIFYHDDDGYVDQRAYGKVALMLEKLSIVGLKQGRFPDTDTKSHIKRFIADYHMPGHPDHPMGNDESGQVIKSGNISGNSMGVNVFRVNEHFPEIYNEDWFFKRASYVLNKVGLVDDLFNQDEHNPLTVKRARQQVFGEAVIDGLYWNRSQERSPVARDFSSRFYWEYILERQRKDYLSTLGSLSALPNPKYRPPTSDPSSRAPMPPEQQEEYRIPLQAGLEVNITLEGQQIVDFLKTWRGEDQGNWKDMLHVLGEDQIPIAEICALLGLKRYFTDTDNDPRDIFRR